MCLLSFMVQWSSWGIREQKVSIFSMDYSIFSLLSENVAIIVLCLLSRFPASSFAKFDLLSIQRLFSYQHGS